MLVQYKSLSMRAIKGPGCEPVEASGPTLIITTTGGVDIDGVPLRRWVPRFLAARQTYILTCAAGAVAVVMYHPPIASFEVGGVRFQS